jgi:holo-[acyl-carrier protein] synthase
MIERHGELFITRVYTDLEIEYCTTRKAATQHYAGRWAAKEAVLKALGTGWRRGVHWKNFEVAHEISGKPVLRIHGRAAEIASQMGVRGVNVSITHDAGVAAAVVIFEGD